MNEKISTQSEWGEMADSSEESLKPKRKPTLHEITEKWEDGLKEKFMRTISINEKGCWEWTAGKTSKGYGAMYVSGIQFSTHRISYMMSVGEIPKGLDLDHLCRNRVCCNPSHLEAVTRQINLLRGLTLVAANAAKTHCPKGHEYNEQNTITRRGGRECRACGLAASNKRYNRLKTDQNFILKRRQQSNNFYMKNKQTKQGGSIEL